MVIADLGLEAKALWEKGRREGLPHFGSKSESHFQDFLLAYECGFFYTSRTTEDYLLTTGLWIIVIIIIVVY